MKNSEMMIGYPMYDTLFVITWPSSEAIQFASKELKRDPEVLLKADLLVMGILGV
jgi:hypothetical protein